MAFGIEIKDAFGRVIFSSERPYGGVLVGKFVMPQSLNSAVWVFDGNGYPDCTGRTLRVLQIGAGTHAWSINGNRLTFTAYAAKSGYDTIVLVFAT